MAEWTWCTGSVEAWASPADVFYVFVIFYVYKLLMLCTALSEEISTPSNSFDCSSTKCNVPGSRSAA